MTLNASSIEVLLSNSDTTSSMPFMHDLCMQYKNRVRYANQNSTCSKCNKKPYCEDLVYSAVSMIESLDKEKKNEVRCALGDSEIFFIDRHTKTTRRIA